MRYAKTNKKQQKNKNNNKLEPQKSLKSPESLFPWTQLRHISTDAHERVISLPSVACGAQTEMGRELLRIQTSGRKTNQTETSSMSVLFGCLHQCLFDK